MLSDTEKQWWLIQLPCRHRDMKITLDYMVIIVSILRRKPEMISQERMTGGGNRETRQDASLCVFKVKKEKEVQECENWN